MIPLDHPPAQRDRIWLDWRHGPAAPQPHNFTGAYLQKEGTLQQTLRVPSHLMLLLSQRALSGYSMACADAEVAAERCAAAQAPSPDDVAQLRECRARVMAAEDTLSLLPDEIATRAAWDLTLDARQRDLIVGLLETTLNQLRGELESSDEKILSTADTIRAMRALLDGLKSRPA